ncbi:MULTISPECIES: hypothetical protein [Leclercia]|uniref:hypothetical protein n=1 Tax=Leclercia TaxID=83654 RepID=UPI0012E13575|nr:MULTISPECIES: hypothetical protein [Leclercia]QGU15008.1 hypothetical protein GNG27_10170 [Leclercia sp. 119287]
MRRLLLAVLVCSVLSGCDNNTDSNYVCADRETGYSMAVNLSGFPESVKANGYTYKPFNLSPISHDMKGESDYQFEYSKWGKDSNIYSNIFIVTYAHPLLSAAKVFFNTDYPMKVRRKEAKAILFSDIRASSIMDEGFIDSGDVHRNEHYWMSCKKVKSL